MLVAGPETDTDVVAVDMSVEVTHTMIELLFVNTTAGRRPTELAFCGMNGVTTGGVVSTTVVVFANGGC